MRILGDSDSGESPAEKVGGLLKRVHAVLGSVDPWSEIRERWFGEMIEARADMEKMVEEDADPLGRALLISARCNVFSNEILQSKAFRDDLRHLGLRVGDPVDEGFAHEERSAFEKALSGATRVVFIHDTAPELPGDAVLMAQMHRLQPALRISSFVHDSPMLLKACAGDIERANLLGAGAAEELHAIEGNSLGLMLDEVSDPLRERIQSADLIVAKGSSHHQTLSGRGLPVFSLMRAKCPVTAVSQSCRIGELLLIGDD